MLRLLQTRKENVVVFVICGFFGVVFVFAMFFMNHFKANLSTDDVESFYLNTASASNCKEYLRKYTTVFGNAGTESALELTKYTQQKLVEFGIPQVYNKTYNVHLTYPTGNSRVQLLLNQSSVVYECTLKEDVLSQDPSSNVNAIDRMGFVGYSPSGDVVGDLVFANYGTREDFQFLDQQHISLTGKIVIVRYGQVFRGVKTKLAEERGAAGLLIYSDPADDGASKGATYPAGPWRPSDGIQRGSVEYIFLQPGDPTTPGWASTEGAQRIPIEESNIVPQSIIIQPISARDALPLLQALGGAQAPQAWQGGLGITYRVGGDGATHVRMKIEQTGKLVPIHNIIGEITGAIEPDRKVIVGNHRDSWLYGAVDPHSGSAALLEMARLLGLLLKQGWKPRRTIVLASWDAEEYGLIGSTEYAEELAAMLDKQAVAYINVDSFTGDIFGVDAAPVLSSLIRKVAERVPFKAGNTSKSVYDSWYANQQADDAALVKAETRFIGSGSDYTAFYENLGIPSLNIYFKGNYGVYHSLYDSFTWVSKWGDPEFLIHKNMVQIWGLTAISLADTPILPFNLTECAAALSAEWSAFSSSNFLLTYMGAQSNTQQKTLQSAVAGVRAAFGVLSNAAAKLASDINVVGGSLAKNKRLFEAATEMKLRALNDRLMYAERGFLKKDGLKARPWYKHTITAPGFHTGYGAATFPGVRDAISLSPKDYSRAATAADDPTPSQRLAAVVAELSSLREAVLSVASLITS